MKNSEITAEEARKDVSPIREEKIRKELNEIHNTIRNAIEKGKYSTVVKCFYEENEKRIKNDDFEIIGQRDPDGNMTISWEPKTINFDIERCLSWIKNEFPECLKTHFNYDSMKNLLIWALEHKCSYQDEMIDFLMSIVPEITKEEWLQFFE